MGASLEPLLLSNKGLVLENKGMFPSSNGLWKKCWTAQSMRRRRVQGRRRSRRAMRSLMKRRALSEGSSTRPRVGMQKRVVDPIHDQTFYLTTEHKMQLREEYGIEPWTFVQNLGEAVFIPAGCPHQVRNLESCLKVAVDFVSPENVKECLSLADEFRVLPQNHRAKEDKLEVKKMTIHAIGKALQDLKVCTTDLTMMEGKKSTKRLGCKSKKSTPNNTKKRGRKSKKATSLESVPLKGGENGAGEKSELDTRKQCLAESGAASSASSQGAADLTEQDASLLDTSSASPPNKAMVPKAEQSTTVTEQSNEDKI